MVDPGNRTTIGGRDQGIPNDAALDGYIAEVIAYNTNVSTIEKQQIESYLALKYGMTLDQSTPTDYLASDGTTTIWKASDNTGYENDIFGIGADNVSTLDQRVSKSVNANAILTVALDNDFTVANNNVARTTEHTNNLQFLVLSNNGGATTTQTTELDDTTYGLRTVREWKVDKTDNFTQEVHLKFDGFNDSYILLRDADGDFSSDAIAIGNLDANGEITAVALADGEYLTLATLAETHSVSGIVFYDEDGEGDLDAGETTRLQDVSVALYDDNSGAALNNGSFDGDETLVDTEVSVTSTGAYTFSDVLQGSYFVVVDHTDSALNNDANNGSITYGATTAKARLVTVSSADIVDEDFGFDEPVVTLATDETSINESGASPAVATLTTTITPTTGFDTTVALALSGTATSGGTDYTASATSITILADAATGTETVTVEADDLIEGDETVIADIDTVTNAVESGSQQVTITIADDEISTSATGTLIANADGLAISDGADTETITVQLKDDSGNDLAIPGINVSFSVTGSAVLSSATATTIADGSVSITLTDTVEEEVTINVTVDHDDNGGTAELAITNGAPLTVVFSSDGAKSLVVNAIEDVDLDENLVYTSVTPSLGGTPSGAVTYTLGGADAADFTINPTTGIVSMVARDFENPMDANTDNVYELIITATDTGSNTDSESWTVTVNDVIETSVFSINALSETVSENAAFTGTAPTVTGTPSGNLTYGISGADATLLSINPTTGVVSMLAKDFENPVDANTDNTYAYTITATDEDSNVANENWQVTVQDVTETVTITIDAIGDTNVNENAAYISITPSITGTPIGAVTYTLSGTDAADFTINASTGVVSMVARDFEAPADADTDNVYEVTITATGDDSNADSEDWIVTVDDVAETVTFTIDAIADLDVDENVVYTSVTPNITGSPVGAVTYTLGGTDAADFTIDSGTGVVSMVARDFENPVDNNADNVYELTITATDTDSNTDSEDWTVTVDNVTETVTITIDAIADTNVNENAIYTSVTPSITGSPIGAVTYALSGTDAADFTINASTGVVSMVARDFEAPADADTDNVYEVTITATDDDGNADSESWTVTVDDVAETVTFTIDAIADVNVNENVAYTSGTPNITGTPVGAVTYTLGGTDAADFTIDPGTGVVSMVARDFENPVDNNADNVYELTITATDTDSNTDSEDWIVTIDNVMETVTITIDAIADTNVNENAIYTSVTPSITGSPIGAVTYALSGTDAADFTINASTGVVSMVARDFEAPADADTDNVYEVTITATDDDSNTDSEDWTVTVDDVAETVTFTIDAIADVNVNENVVYTSVTPNITGSPVGAVTYTLGGTDAADFTINPSTGVVSMVARDFENPADNNTDNVYELTITATDTDSNTDSEDWTVTVDNVVETVTITIDAIADTNVNENSAYISITPSITGTPIGVVTYTLSGTDAADFTINATTGVVSMVVRDFEAPDDANTDNIYEVTITATDSDSNTDSENWTVTVDDLVEAAGFTINSIVDIIINENAVYTSTTPSVVGTPVGAITYTLGGTDAASFTIDGATGVVSMIARDFETPADNDTDNVYEVTITGTDTGSNTDTESWIVTVDDVIETVSLSLNALTETVLENAAFTGTAPTVTGSPIGNLVFTISGTDSGLLAIDSATGVVSMVARDFENPADANTDNEFEYTITVTDDDGNTANENWTVTVQDVIETASFTIDAIVDTNVNENAVYTSVTPIITGTPVGAVTYTLGGTDAASFTINAATGVVSMVVRDFENPLDADTDNVYELTITATDADGNLDSENWTVTVDDMSETTSFTIDAIANTSIDEETPYTGPTPSISGSPIGNVVYTIGGADAAIFSLNSITGVVAMPLRSFENPDDVNGDNVYEVSITATDEDGNADTESWSITLLDVVEIASFTIDVIADDNVSENVAYTSVTPSITGSPIGSVNYTLSGADAASFSINVSTGVVSMAARDFETPVDVNTDNVYEVTITATDSDANTASTSWTVTIDDVVESATGFNIDPIANVNIDENSVYTSVTPSITGTPVGTLTYTLSGADAASFTINASTGVVSMVARDFENPSDSNTDNVYEVTITATDTASNTDSEDWIVTVQNITEVVSFTINAIADANVSENTTYTSATPSITGSPMGTVAYTLGGADAASFTINATTGVVSMVARDFETPEDVNTDNVYEVTITATDSDANTASENWTVTIDDVVESITGFSIDPIANVSIDENAAYTSVTPSITGTPVGALTYTLSGADAASFTVNASTGVVSMVVRDFENPSDSNTDNVYEVTITATDTASNTDSEDWIVTVQNVVEGGDDTDGDGTPDSEDAFPNNPDEDTDSDGDGMGDNGDDDDDNDGTPDSEDAFPNNPNEDKDTDGDGMGDNVDDDDDGDGIPDVIDDSPTNASEVLIPAEAFTPNGDGINDSWVIPGIENYPNSVLTVYNRWGHEVFAAQGYQNDWEGMYKTKSNKLPPGSYLYIINLNNGTLPIQGWVFVNY